MATTKIQEAVKQIQATPDAFTSQLPLPDDETIEYVETEIGIQLPPDYRHLAQNAGNVVLSKELLYLRRDREGRCNLLSAIFDARKSGVPSNWLPICRDNADYYCLLPDGSVNLWSHDGMFEGRWDDLSDWIIDSFIQGN